MHDKLMAKIRVLRVLLKVPKCHSPNEQSPTYFLTLITCCWLTQGRNEIKVEFRHDTAPRLRLDSPKDEQEV